jgi:hypothetical protein
MASKFKACSIDRCNGNAHYSVKGARGYCSAHYGRFTRHGDPLGGKPTMEGDPLRFVHAVVIPYDGGDCLAWPYTRISKGYGQISIDGKMITAHRYVCTIAHGTPPSPKYQASHNCGKGHLGCVNPQHLEWKTVKANHSDKLIHGTSQRGERCSRSKLLETQVREILKLKGLRTQRELASEFGVNPATICAIYRRKTWAWLLET